MFDIPANPQGSLIHNKSLDEVIGVFDSEFNSNATFFLFEEKCHTMQLSVLFYPQEKQNVNHSFFGSNVWVGGWLDQLKKG